MPLDLDTLRLGLTRTVDATDFPGLGEKYEGKVRDNYSLSDGTRVLVTTDRISAFDRVLGTLPFKGQVLNGLSTWWFAATADVAANHVLSVPDPNILHAVECEPLPVELVVRSFVTGVTSTSVWTHYAEGKRSFAGHVLPEGLKKNEPLPAPILTPSTKAAKGGHDVTVSRAELLAMGQVSEEDFDAAGAMAMKLFARGQEICRQRGIILVDTKYEMGKRPDGTIVVIDEIHTPDSSRYWLAASYEQRLARGEEPESFDKEFVRRWLAGVGFKGDGPIPAIPDEVRVEASRRYVEACEMIRGEPFVADLTEPSGRMASNLVRAGIWKR
ncbi:MAG: phosphoribosylaminoimidazolesuccinocarboxamide synthase [Deltaproteobacteria bacterium]|jgi:phosphoribosylaminoimidazole-succinocarboxamide synthase